MKWLALTVLVFAAIGSNLSAVGATDAPSDRDAIQGTWRMVSREAGGRSRDDESGRLVFKGDRFQIMKDGEMKIEETFKIDAAAKPRRIDMYVEKANDDTHTEKKTSLGIYELNGDDLRWCADEPGHENRPTEFSGQPEGHMLVVLKREPAEAK